MSRFVRASKYRHVFGQPGKKEYGYENLKVSNSAWDTNFIAASGVRVPVADQRDIASPDVASKEVPEY
ncbi:hypothetical protein NM688_g6983 [Phlebia brevispora]|uniref:Uncharacterized protein n=1 Tax=Phlebia brevispora TaxID=194682 RepID=A0ACC1SAB8_9APHY|nr:hypothetical protein NM688_g6983 [Phlebia brevispora]